MKALRGVRINGKKVYLKSKYTERIKKPYKRLPKAYYNERPLYVKK